MNDAFQVDKNDLFACEFASPQIPVIAKTEVLLRIANFAFTSNNITYAVVGDKLGYWNFFPSTGSKGIIPVWGFAEVVSSKHNEIEVGSRYYGYWPMSTFLKVLPTRVTPYGFLDGTEHRKGLPTIYNYYSKSPNGWDTAFMGYYSIIKPLFTTAYLNYRFLNESSFFGASQIVLTSASSKTALGIAFMLHRNRELHGKHIVALTSKRNVGFVTETSFYDQVICYEAIESALRNQDTVVVDLAGNTGLLLRLGEQLGDGIKHVSLIGLADWKAAGSMKKIPKSTFFFAPDHAKTFYAELGQAQANEQIEAAQTEFTSQLKKWQKLELVDFRKGMKSLYLKMLKGEIEPSKGYVVTTNEIK